MTDFNVTGRLAQFGRGGIMEDVSNRLMRDFATCLSSRLAEGPPAADAATPSGAEVTAGNAAPDAVAAAVPTGSSPPPSVTPPPAATPPAAAPVKGFSRFFSVLWERIKRLFRRS